jgi:hypothetical protein
LSTWEPLDEEFPEIHDLEPVGHPCGV